MTTKSIRITSVVVAVAGILGAFAFWFRWDGFNLVLSRLFAVEIAGPYVLVCIAAAITRTHLFTILSFALSVFIALLGIYTYWSLCYTPGQNSIVLRTLPAQRDLSFVALAIAVTDIFIQRSRNATNVA